MEFSGWGEKSMNRFQSGGPPKNAVEKSWHLHMCLLEGGFIDFFHILKRAPDKNC